MNTNLFQICQKIVVIDEINQTVLLARRKGEADFDGVFSFIGGKLENSDGSIEAGLTREKNEEIGELAKLTIDTEITWNTFFTKKDGNQMFLPHYYARYEGGEIQLNSEEYEEYKWVPISDLQNFEPKIPTIPQAVEALLKIRSATHHSIDISSRSC